MKARILMAIAFGSMVTLAIMFAFNAPSGDTIASTDVQPSDVQPTDVQPTNLASDDNDLRWKTASAIGLAHWEATKQAIQIVEQGQGKMTLTDKRRPAIRVLGVLRDPAAIPVLCSAVDLHDPLDFVSESGGPFIGDYYPAAGALVEIGKKAANACVHELGRNISDQRRECLCWVIGRVEGPQVGRFVLKLVIDRENDKWRKARLNEALSVLEKLFPLVEDVPAK
ncbi:MAG: hypothetical protein IID44_21160 [Planctomycetes bacterium]|nr:hypothetical protein [Planctomycetota bacterium]